MCNEFWCHNNSETGQTEQSDSLEMNRMCKIDFNGAKWEKISARFFFSLWEFWCDFLQKMREYREISPENDPWDRGLN